jgi:hypothetical protein
MQCKAGLQVAVPMRHGVVEKQTQACREAQNRVLFYHYDGLIMSASYRNLNSVVGLKKR